MNEFKVNQAETALGIEFGSTRIKAVLIDKNHEAIAEGSYNWESYLLDGIWTYSLSDIWTGLENVYRELADNYENKYGEKLTTVGSIGLSAMMHGYLAFDKEAEQLTPFRTWRNTNTEVAAEKLSELFQFNIPQRWSIAHLYQAILNGESHVENIDFFTTLAGYVHWRLTGEKVLGVGEASGMFPIDSQKNEYNDDKIQEFEKIVSSHDFGWSLAEILPEILVAGEIAGRLTEEGAKLLDPTGNLEAGIPLAPPEGDAGTGMVATNAISPKTGNVSAGTSIFSMIVLEEELSDYYLEVDIVTTPTGTPVAMIHCNNFTSDINSWANLFKEVIESLDLKVAEDDLFTMLFNKSTEADADNGKLYSVNYYTGEPITGFEDGRPLFVQMPDSKLTVPNFMRTKIYSALATLKIGMDILTYKEKVSVDYLLGHGGFFKTENVGQQIMADGLEVPISVMETASEGGSWGMAILAAYSINKKDNETLEAYLESNVFHNQKAKTLYPSEHGTKEFRLYMETYDKLLKVERAAIDWLK